MLDALFSPLDLGPVTIPNRIVSTSHQTSLVHDHLPTADLVAYHGARAAGGAGLIVIEATAIHPTGLLTPHTIGGYLPEIVPAYRRLAAAVEPHGTRLFCQLFHGGREMITDAPRAPAVAPSSIPSGRFMTEPRALTRAEIAEMVDGYRQAAAYARQGGLHGVEVCAGFGYLPTQFLSRHTNTRADAYGGSFDNRLRFLREVLAAMRDGIGADGAVGVRFTDESPSADGTDGQDVLRAVRVLTSEGLADYVSAALGSSSTYRGSLYIVPPSPIARNAVSEFAAAVREASAAPVIATGRVLDPGDADRMVREGVCDAVGMTRALITDPSMPRAARAGERFTACIGCNQGCIGHYHAGLPIACTINPWTGFERTLRRPAPAAEGGTVVVIGAGPAGAAAAACARGCGHRVVVFERAGAAGGQMRLGLNAPGKAEVAAGLIATLETWLEGCDVRYGVEAAPELVAAERPDRVIDASGAGAHRPTIAGAGVRVVTAWEALAGAAAGPRVVVHDWGGDWTGLDCAEALAAGGRTVRLACAAASFGAAIHQYQRNLYLDRLDRAGVELVHHVRVTGVREGAVEMRNVFSNREVVLEGVDTLVLSEGRSAGGELYERLVNAGLEVLRAGDVLSPRSFEEAIREGTEAGLSALTAPAALS